MRENDSVADSESETQVTDYAFWEVPGASAKVIYSLQLFHEIDFVVNEGYRKIPHGGIEVGGLLFGTIQDAAVRIEAFRPIECEHASGPSLNLSERDLTELETQIAASGFDSELAKLKPVGWFLAHTRGPLDLTASEAGQFDRFFPKPLQVTVLVKPERFQPTRFGFLVRKSNGEMPREGTSLAVILPLPGRSHKPGQLIASISAPAPSAATKRPTLPPERVRPVPALDEEEAPRPPRLDKPTGPLSIWKIPPDQNFMGGPEAADDYSLASESPLHGDSRTPEEKAARRQLGRDRVRVIEQAFSEVPPFHPASTLATYSPQSAAAKPDRPNYTAPGSQAPGSLTPYGYSAATFPQPGYAPVNWPEGTPNQGAGVRRAVFNPRSLTALALAAVLGCIAGYVGYLQLPGPIISLDVHSVNQTIVVAWPQDQTRNAIYAAIRFNDGAPVSLSPEEKMAGQVSLAAAKDFKVEVMARNWIRDSRGIVRYVHAVSGTTQPPVPSETLP